ncbi:MAG TPA: magnesium transporter [Lachnospiraceae bacterium]|nr:magnesium transporter [Lachnospiraceae bacterium]
MKDNTTLLLNTTLTTLVENKKYNTIKDILLTMNPVDIAEIFGEVPEQKLPILFRLLPQDQAAETFAEMDTEQQQTLIEGFSDHELKEVVNELCADDAADLVDDMPANVVKRILRQADPEMRRMINELLKYPEDTAGSIMTPEFVRLRPEMTVDQAIISIRRTGLEKETINDCFITDRGSRLMGTVSIRTLIVSRADAVIQDIMNEHAISVEVKEDQEVVARMFDKYNLMVLPVVDAEDHLVGIITVDDVLDVLKKETTEDMELMAAITPSDSDRPYIKTPVVELWKNRIPWLLLLMVSATVTGFIITRFEKALSVYVILTAYIPMLMDTGGNSGSQTSVTVIRALSLQELEFKDLFQAIWKEMRVALLCGATLAVVNFAKLMVIDRVGTVVAAVICCTLLVTVFVAKITGCVLPMVAKKLGFDPAVMASPFITTIVDALSLLIYFRFATVFLGI